MTPKRFAKLVTGQEQASELSTKQWTQFLLYLRETRLVASFYYVANNNDSFGTFPDWIKRHLISAKVHAERQAQQVRYESAEINRVLLENGIRAHFLKGASYILRKSRNSFGRIFSDIDLLVSKDQLENVESVLKTKGWRSEELTDYDQNYYRNWAHEIPPMYHPFRRTILDIHHNLYLPVSGRAPDIELFTHSPILIDDISVLGNVETVMHSLIHLYMNEDFTNAFRDLVDIYCLLMDFEGDDQWQTLKRMSETSGFEFELCACLEAMQYYFDLPIPGMFDDMLEQQSSGFWRRLWSSKLLLRAATPSHSSLMTWKHHVARQAAYLRGHWLKMPVGILIKHLAIKSWLSVGEALLGKYSLRER